MLVCSANSGLHVFDFLANSILKEVLMAIQRGKPGAFSSGRPTEFLRNYKSSLSFLAVLEGKPGSTIVCSVNYFKKIILAGQLHVLLLHFIFTHEIFGVGLCGIDGYYHIVTCILCCVFYQIQANFETNTPNAKA